jgi:molybdopterin molybdotransferase
MLLPFEKAYEITIGAARLLGTERLDLDATAGRILAEDIKSDTDIPPFDKSAMDGFACRRADLAGTLTVIETIPAGGVPERKVEANQCSKIMTGAMIPEGADCVIMKEYVEPAGDNNIRFVGDKTADNIRYKGEDVALGDVVLQKGTQLKPQHIAVLASAGSAEPLVAQRPRIAVIATGSELILPQAKPQPGKIRESNAVQLTAHIGNIGLCATNYGIVPDTAEEIDAVFKKALEQSDVVIVSGGVSVGDFDFVPQILRQNNIELLFEKVATKPGKPTVFGMSEKAYCFGLPGNPVSTFVQFELLVKPFLYKMMGHDYKPLNIQIPLEQPLINKRPKRQRWLPVTITDKGTVKLIEYHGSAHINALSNADGLVCMDIGVTEIAKATPISVRLI